MPRRPRQHQLEELSRRAFRARLPEAWVVRDLNPDYGLDVAVDIFENELATGLSFAVQLKATENDDLRRALSNIRFTVDMAAFYRAYEVPVLVALFHVPTDRLFAKWFHAFDPHYSTSAVHGSRPSRTFSFRLLESDEWVDDTPSRLVAEVKGFRRYRSPELHLPVRFHLTLAEQEVHGATVVEHAFALRQAASGVADLVRITTEGQAAGEPTILLTQEKQLSPLVA